MSSISSEEVAEVRSDNEWLVDLVESSGLPMVALDDERRYIALSDSAEAIHEGRSREDPLGRQADTFLSPDKAEEFVAHFQELQDSGFATSRVSILGEDGIAREITALFSRHVAPGINLAVTLSGLEPDPGDPGEPQATSVLVAAPDQLSSSMITAACRANTNLKVAAECSDLSHLEAAILGHRPQVTIISTSPFSLVKADEITASLAENVEAAVSSAERNGVQTGVLVLTHLSRPDLVKGVMKAGALGVFGPDENPERFAEAIARVAQKEPYVSPSLAAAIVTSERDSLAAKLTPRELEVLRLIALGYTNQEAAEEMYLSVRTVEGHRARVNDYVGSSKRKDLVAFAIEHQVIP